MAGNAYTEIGPISKDGEDMFRMIVMPFGGKVIRFDNERDVAVVKFPDADTVDTMELPGYFVTTLPGDPTTSKQHPPASSSPTMTQQQQKTEFGNDNNRKDGDAGQYDAADSAGGSPRSSTLADTVTIAGSPKQATTTTTPSSPSNSAQRSSLLTFGIGHSTISASSSLPSSSASTTTASSTGGVSTVALRKRCSPSAASSGLEPLPASDPFYLITDVNIACPMACGFLLLYTLIAIVGIV